MPIIRTQPSLWTPRRFREAAAMVGWYKVSPGDAEIPTPLFVSSFVGWTAEAPWTSAGDGIATIDGSQATAKLIYLGCLAIGDTYTVEFTIDSITPNGANGVLCRLGSGTSSPTRITPGTYTFTGTCATSADLGFSAAASVVAQISNIKITKHTVPYLTLRASPLVNGSFTADANWVKSDASWSIVSGSAICNGTQSISGSNISQDILVLGDTYKSTIDVTSVSGGSGFWIQFGSGTQESPITSSGTYTYTNVCTGSTVFAISASVSCSCEISNVTLQPMHVSQLSDLSGYGRHLLQSTSTKQPVYSETGGPNGKPSLIFNGTSNALKAAAFTWNRPNLVLGIIKWINNGATSYVFDGNTANSLAMLESVTDLKMKINQGANFLFNPLPSSGVTYLYECLFNGASSATSLNGATRTTGNAGTTSQAGGFTLGARGDGVISYSNIVVSEIVLLSRDVVDDERKRVKTYLNNGWRVY